MKNYRIHFIRHGLTDLNSDGRLAGSRNDCEISIEGMRELVNLRETYEYPPVGMVYSSPMTRCIQTAGILYPHGELMTVPQLREVDFGDFSGKTVEELKDNDHYRAWLADAVHVAPPNGESGEQFIERLIEGFRWILDDMMKSEIYDAAIVTHGGVIMTLLSAIGIPRRQPTDWLVGNGRGYTCFMNPQLWQRDGIIEVAGIMPHGATNAMGDLEEQDYKENSDDYDTELDDLFAEDDCGIDAIDLEQ